MILSAGVIPVRPTPEGFRFLLLRVYSHWDFPKGEVEPGEDTLAAARREAAEETGIDDLEFPWGLECCDTPPYGRGKVARYYLGQTRSAEVTLGVNPQLGRPEHHEYRWVSAYEAFRLLNHRLAEVLRWGLQRLESVSP